MAVDVASWLETLLMMPRNQQAEFRHTDLMLDVVLWIEIALLAYIVAIWEMPVQTAPPLFLIGI